MNPVLLILALALALTACKKPEAATPPAQPTTSTAATGNGDQPATPIQPPPNPNGGRPGLQAPPDQVVIPQTADLDATLAQLTQTLRSYVYTTRTKLRDFNDLVTRTHLQYPPPPSGKAYAISGGQVVLVDQSK